jgi:adenylate cyclase
MANFAARNYQQAIDAFKRAPKLGHVQRAALAAYHAALGNMAAAEIEAARVLELKPEFSIAAELARSPYQFEADAEHHRDALLKAGLPA